MPTARLSKREAEPKESSSASPGGKDGYGWGKAMMIESSERTRYSTLLR